MGIKRGTRNAAPATTPTMKKYYNNESSVRSNRVARDNIAPKTDFY